MTEIVFIVEAPPEGGFTARALGKSIFTEADTEAELRVAAQDAVRCHFDVGTSPKVIRLHFVRQDYWLRKARHAETGHFEGGNYLPPAAEKLTPALGTAAACRAMGLWRGAPGRHTEQSH